MKLLAMLLLALSSMAFADEITLSRGQGYVVPEGKVWRMADAPPAECRVCTADVYIRGEQSRIEIDGVALHGPVEFSFTGDAGGEVRLFPGTEIWLGDTRPTLSVEADAQ